MKNYFIVALEVGILFIMAILLAVAMFTMGEGT